MNRPEGTRLSRLFWSKVTPSPDGCWLWGGFVMDNGYGRTSGPVIDGKRPNVLTHRLVYADLIGDIPEGLTVDHRCHDSSMCLLGNACPHRRCLNPEHLRVMTGVDNSMRRWDARTEAMAELPGGFHGFVAARRAEGRSWYRVSVDLYDATGGLVDVPPATVRKWASELDLLATS